MADLARWAWRPRAVVIRAADPITGVRLNRYPDAIIGVVFYLRGRGLSLLWKGSPRRRPVPRCAADGCTEVALGPGALCEPHAFDAMDDADAR